MDMCTAEDGQHWLVVATNCHSVNLFRADDLSRGWAFNNRSQLSDKAYSHDMYMEYWFKILCSNPDMRHDARCWQTSHSWCSTSQEHKVVMEYTFSIIASEIDVWVRNIPWCDCPLMRWSLQDLGFGLRFLISGSWWKFAQLLKKQYWHGNPLSSHGDHSATTAMHATINLSIKISQQYLSSLRYGPSYLIIMHELQEPFHVLIVLQIEICLSQNGNCCQTLKANVFALHWWWLRTEVRCCWIDLTLQWGDQFAVSCKLCQPQSQRRESACNCGW